jgi:hypothetical protein
MKALQSVFVAALVLVFSLQATAAPPVPARDAPAAIQLRTLPPPPRAGRFEMSYERVWPAEPGEAHVCLWAGDKYAAVSVTIDDNCQPDHEWWIEQGRMYGFRFTWFVITGSIGQPTKSFSGTWDDFRRLQDLGHDVQSHCVSHHKDDDQRPDEEVRAEYRDSQEAVRENVPGSRPVCMAYPWGKGKDDIAADYYIACRGVQGTPNLADKVNYMRTGTCNIEPDTVDMLLTGEHPSVHWLDRPVYRRAWLAPVYHYVHHGRTPEEKDASQARVAAQLAHLASRKDEIWVGLFREVACYGMERDTAHLDVTKSTGAEIRFTLSDDMDDALFDYPLTVKVRLPDAWEAVKATQSAEPVDVRIVEHEGARFGLAEVVPDRGEVVLSP